MESIDKQIYVRVAVMTASRTGSDVSVGVVTYVVSPSINNFSSVLEFFAENRTGKLVCDPCSTRRNSRVIEGLIGYPLPRCSPLSGINVMSTPALFSKFTLMYLSAEMVVAAKDKLGILITHSTALNSVHQI